MSVHKKLMQARIKLHSMDLKKSGENKFAGYKYFELGDFLPSVMHAFDLFGLCGVISYDNEYARLCITDVEDGTAITITSPMAEANLKGAHAIQNLGAVETYQRRYLWMTAMEIVEHDAIDASEPSKPTKAPEPVKLEKPVPAPTGKAPVKIEGRDGQWQLKVTADSAENLQAWIGVVMDAARIALTTAQSQKDVMDIFKVNRNIFDKLKQESAEDHELLMAEFSTAKKKFGEAK
jgi:hypothetical protein